MAQRLIRWARSVLLVVCILLAGCLSYPTWSYSYTYPVPRPGQGARIIYQTAAMARAEYPRYFHRLFLVTNHQAWVQPDFVEGGDLVRTIGGPPGREYTIQIGVGRRVAPHLPDISVLLVHVDGRTFRLKDPAPVYTFDWTGERQRGTAEFIVDDALLDALVTAKTVTFQTTTARHVQPTGDVIDLNYAVPMLRTLPEEMPPDWRPDI